MYNNTIQYIKILINDKIIYIISTDFTMLWDGRAKRGVGGGAHNEQATSK